MLDVGELLCLDCLGMRAHIVRGHLEMLLLAVVASGAAYGYAIVEELSRRSGGEFDLPEGTIYPALYRLERGGLLRSTWDRSAGRPRRVYQLTRAGSRALADRRREWAHFTRAVSGILEPAR